MSEEKSIEELEAQYVEELNKKTERIKQEREAFEAQEAETAKTEYEQGLKDQWEKEYKESHTPVTKIVTKVETPIGGEQKKFVSDEYLRAFSNKVVNYEDFISGEITEYTDSNSGCDNDISNWSPTETFANIVWQSMYCEADLFKVCVKGLDISAGDGLNITIRTIGKFGAPTEATACQTLSCVSASLSEYHLTCKQYGEVTEVCNFDVFDAGEVYRREYLKAFGKRWAEFYDQTIYDGLVAAAAGTSTDLAATLSCSAALSAATDGSNCCTNADLLNMYNAVNATIASMREGTTPYNPDYMIVSPTVASIFKNMQTPAVQAWAEKVISVDGAGKLTRFNGIKVIEYCGAQTCSTATDTVYAVLVDSRRAYGAAFGKRPSLEKDRNIDANSWTYAMWSYFGHGALDLNAIAFIKSPDA